MSNRIVVTISREYGSGGREVGRLLAEMLGIPFYDKELLTYMGESNHFDPELFQLIDVDFEFSNFYLADELAPKGKLHDLGVLEIQERIQRLQEKTIRHLAKESCVIIGRCSDYILRDDVDCVHVFIRADIQDKRQRAIHEYGEALENINEKLLSVDTQRGNYYNYFTSRVWGRPSNYDMMISTSHLKLEECAKVLRDYIEMRNR